MASPALVLTVPILERMRAIEGWLEDAEADLLVAGLVRALAEVPEARAVVEVGSYHGRSTVVLASVVAALRADVRVYAIDPHEGEVSAPDNAVEQMSPTLAAFRRNIAAGHVGHVVETIQKRSHEVSWNQPIAFLFVDGLHDFESVSRDFLHFEPWLADGAYVAFHDYVAHWPGVQVFVDTLVSTGHYERLHLAGSMILIRRRRAGLPSGGDGALVRRVEATGLALASRVPHERLRRAATNRVRSVLHVGRAVRCPLCRWRFARLRDNWVRANAVCWRCGSQPWHRAVWLFLQAHRELLASTNSIVYVSPVWCLEHRLQRRRGLRYLAGSNPLGLPERSVDAILAPEPASHERQTLRQIARILAPDGWALLTALSGELAVEGLRYQEHNVGMELGDAAARHGVTAADGLILCRPV
jgi:hypothetical protein